MNVCMDFLDELILGHMDVEGSDGTQLLLIGLFAAGSCSMLECSKVLRLCVGVDGRADMLVWTRERPWLW